MELNQVTLPVKNMAEATAFYLQLGFTQIVDTPHYARFSCPVGSSTFSLALEQGEFKNGAVVYFESQRLDALVEELIAKGFVFDQQPTEQRYLWKEAILRDPCGNKIKLYRAGENRLEPPWKVKIQA